MFTGIVESVGIVVEIKAVAAGHHVRIRTALADQLIAGDSLAVNGVCLTATLVDDGEVHADIGPETARITTLGGLQRGQGVNLERALKLDDRLGGHLVLGHVDEVGVVDDIRPDSGGYWLTVRFPEELARFFIRKGSVAVDGVSLTVAGLGDREFDVQIVPYTWEATTLSRLSPGDKVNLECDMIGKYVVRALEAGGNLPPRRG